MILRAAYTPPYALMSCRFHAATFSLIIDAAAVCSMLCFAFFFCLLDATFSGVMRASMAISADIAGEQQVESLNMVGMNRRNNSHIVDAAFFRCHFFFFFRGYLLIRRHAMRQRA